MVDPLPFIEEEETERREYFQKKWTPRLKANLGLFLEAGNFVQLPPARRLLWFNRQRANRLYRLHMPWLTIGALRWACGGQVREYSSVRVYLYVFCAEKKWETPEDAFALLRQLPGCFNVDTIPGTICIGAAREALIAKKISPAEAFFYTVNTAPVGIPRGFLRAEGRLRPVDAPLLGYGLWHTIMAHGHEIWKPLDRSLATG